MKKDEASLIKQDQYLTLKSCIFTFRYTLLFTHFWAWLSFAYFLCHLSFNNEGDHPPTVWHITNNTLVVHSLQIPKSKHNPSRSNSHPLVEKNWWPKICATQISYRWSSASTCWHPSRGAKSFHVEIHMVVTRSCNQATSSRCLSSPMVNPNPKRSISLTAAILEDAHAICHLMDIVQRL